MLRSYSWSKTSLSSLPSFRGLYRCRTKSQHPVHSHRSVGPASRFRVSRQRAGAPFWLGLLLPGLGNQKLSSEDILEPAWSGKICFTSVCQLQTALGPRCLGSGNEPDLLYHLPHGVRGEAHPQHACTGHPGPSAVIETI